MIMEAVRGCRGGSPVPHTSPIKRTFDVAFLTGARDDATTPDAKVSRVSEPHTPPATSSPPSSPPQDDATPGSAFTKVTRTQGSSPPQVGPGAALNALSWPPVSASFNAVTSLLGSHGKSLAPLLAAPGLLPPGLAPFLPPAPDRFNNNLVEEYLKSQHQILDANLKSQHLLDANLKSQHLLDANLKSQHQQLLEAAKSPSSANQDMTEALTRLRSTMYPSAADPYKLPFTSLSYPLSPPDAAKLPSPFLPQPSVSAMMPPSISSLALSAQNVCAKCNISFRMTSDLVYHMRSQHRREPDPYKKRRNEKLKCTHCGESFRERHHLTRHMSAHQDRKEEEN